MGDSAADLSLLPPPRSVRRFRALNRPAKMHAYLAAGWLLMVIPTVAWWSESILWLGFMSIYAIVVGHWSAVEAARETPR